MKKLLLSLLLLFPLLGHAATTWYFCNCGVGMTAGCVAGDGTTGTSPATAFTTPAQYKTKVGNMAAGDSLLACQGGAVDSFSMTGTVQNLNATKSNPITLGSYDDSARWTGGAGIKPKFNCASGGVDCFSFNKATSVHTEGYVIQDIEIVGASDTPRGIFIAQDDDYVTVQRVKITGVGIGIQCLGGATATIASGNGYSEHMIFRDSTISNNRSDAIEASCFDMLIEHNVMDSNGTLVTDHHIYVDGESQAVAAVAIASVVGDGTTVTVTTSVPHNIPGGTFKLTKTGTTSSGFNATNVAATAINQTQFTYTNATAGTASVVGAYTAVDTVNVDQVVIRGNTLTNAAIGAHGTCLAAALVVHGQYSNVIIENNTVREDTVPTSTNCWGIGISSGSYNQPWVESFSKCTVRGNKIDNFFIGINLDLTQNCIAENNEIYTEISTTNQLAGIRYPLDSSALNAFKVAGTRAIARNNSIYFKNPNSGGTSVGIQISRDGTNHQIVSNLIYFGAGGTTNSTQCFNSDGKSSGTVHSDATYQLANTAFDAWDYNLCFGSGFTPTWSWDGGVQNALAAHQTWCSGISCDTHSLTTDPTITAPTASAYSLAIPTGSPAKNAGHPTRSSTISYGGLKRDASPDIGANEFGATTVVPNAATRISVQ